MNTLDGMVHNCENFADITTNIIVELFETAVKSKFKIEKILEIRVQAQIKTKNDILLRETVHDVKTKIQTFIDKYWKLKKRELLSLEKEKKRLTKAKRKEEKRKARLARKEEKKEAKREAKRLQRAEERKKLKEELRDLENEQKDENPFDVMDETSTSLPTVFES